MSEDSSGRVRVFERRCGERGIPMTRQRRATFEVLCTRGDHPTADQVYEEVRKRLAGISRMTVYRILDLVVSLGLARKVCHPGSAVRFDPNVDQHHHLVCLRCERLIDFEDDAFDRLAIPEAAERSGFEVSGYFVQFRGICATCRGQRSKSRTTRGASTRRASGSAETKRKSVS